MIVVSPGPSRSRKSQLRVFRLLEPHRRSEHRQKTCFLLLHRQHDNQGLLNHS